jgi:hypothetical protein
MENKTGAQDAVPMQEVQAFLAAYDPAVQAITLEIRALVLEAVPTAIEQIDPPARIIAYGFDRTYKGMICVILPLKGAVNWGFPRGVDLPDPTGLLDGAGKRARHVKISTLQEVEAPALRVLFEAAVAEAWQRSSPSERV